jgi:hypothetical protein
MLLRQISYINRPPAVVWPYIITPELFAMWNDKVQEIGARDRFQAGQKFTTNYLWKGKAMQCMSMVTRIEEGRLLEIRHERCLGSKIRHDMVVTERINLSGEGERSTVTKNIIVTNHGVPWIFIPCIWFVSRFGKSVGEDKLKRLCEGKE